MLEYSFAELVDIHELQPMAEALYEASSIPTVIIDRNGALLVCTGGSQTCESFHRQHPEAGASCVRNVGILESGLDKWQFTESESAVLLQSTCPNGFRYIGLPIFIEGAHLATLILCSFLFDDDHVDTETLRNKALQFGFEENSYLDSFQSAPRLSRGRTDNVLKFYRHFVGIISRQGLTGLRLRKEMDARQSTMRQLEEQRRYIDALSSTLPEPIFFKDTNGVYRNCNDAFARLLGIPAEHIIGYSDRDILTPEQVGTYQQQDAELYARGGIQRYQAILDDADGDRRELLISKTVYQGSDGTPHGIIGAVTDITALKAAEQKALEHETLYRLFAENAGDVISIVGTDYSLQYVSPSIEHLLGYTPEEAKVMDFEEMFLPESYVRFTASLRQDSVDPSPAHRAKDEGFRSEYILISKDGSTIWAELVVTPLRENSHEVTGWLCVARDITDRKDFEAQLVAAKDKAESADRAKSEFLANMSHEIRTPLNGIFGMLQLLSSSTRLDEEQTQYVNVALESGKSLVTIIEDILEFSRFDTGAATFEVAPFSPAEAVETVIDNFIIEARTRNLTLELNISDNVPDIILGDVGRLRQILFHLVGNALKFTPQGGVRLDVRRLDGTRKGLAKLSFTITDSGIGIPDDMLADIFEPFSQVDGSYTRKYQGTGIGLGLVKRIVDRLGGEIDIKSVPDQGTKVELILEAPVRQAQPPAEVSAARQQHCESNLPRRILVTEDDTMNQLTAQRFLEKLGYEPTIVSTGEEAIEILRQNDFDLVIMDVQMPGMDGMQTTRTIREDSSLGEKSTIPIIAMTAHAMGEDRENFLAAGMDDYISKPVDMNELRDVLCKQLLSNQDA